jgi:lambda family phage tail tape measure protein
MAEQVARLKILAQIEGLEGFDKLKGAFKGLQQAIGPAETQLSKARQDIIAFGEAGKRTEQIIRGQIDALKALKGQAGAGGQLYTTLGADIRRLEGEVRDLNAAYVDLATGATYTAKQLSNLGAATSKPSMLAAQVRQMQDDLAKFKLLSREYIQGVADINKATQEGQRKSQDNNLFSNALNANPYLKGNYFVDDPAALFERQAKQGGLPATVAAKQAEVSRLKEQLQNVLRDTSNLEPLLNDIRRIEGNLASTRGPATTSGGARTTIPGLEGAGRDIGREWEASRIQLGQLAAEYDRLKQAQQDQVRVLQTQLLDAEDDLQRMLNGTTKEQEQAARVEERRARVLEKLARIQEDVAKAPNVGGYRDPATGAMLARGTEGRSAARENLLSQISMPPREISSLYQSIGGVGFAKISNDIERMGNSYEEVAVDIRKATAASDGSINSLRSQRAAWEELRNTVGNNKAALKEIGKELSTIDRQLEKRIGGGNAFGSRFQTLGAVASGAVFGGPAGFLGGAAGAAFGAASGVGGFAGALGGAAIGAAVGGVGQAAAGASNYASEIARLQIALKGVSTDQREFNNSLKFIKDAAPQFLTSLGDATKNYTRLQASVRGAGMGVNETQTVFKGLSAAIVATGGSTEQLNAAMLAASQVFSKGKVSAEELRGQIGERLPGAFTIFAQAVKMTPQQLDKALQDGKVTTEQFVKFSEELFKRYGDAAKSIGDSPFAASIRFQLAMDNFKLAAGQALLPIVTAFQNFGTEALNSLTRVAEGTTNWQKALGNTFSNVSKLIGGVQGLKDILSGLTKTLLVLGTTMAGVFAVQNIGTFVAAFRTVVGVTTTLVKVTRELLTLEKAITALKAIQGALQAVISGSASGAVKGLRSAKGVGAVVGLAAGAGAAALFKDQIDGAVSGIVDSIGGKFNDMFKMPELGGNFGGQAQNVPPSTGEDSEKAKKEADEQRRLDEANARARVDLDNATHRNAMELIRKRYEFEQELQNKQRDNWVKSFTGVAKSAASLITSFYGEMDGLTNRRREAAFGVMAAQQAAKSAQAMATATGGTGVSPTGVIARTGDTGQSTGPHLDARWADGRRITAEDVDRYISVNGRDPSSYGVTSPYGPRRMFGRSFHNGIDFGTPSGSGIGLRNGATVLRDLGFTGAGGFAVEIQTADGPMRLLHLQGGSTARATASATGNASQQARSIGAEAKSGVEAVDLAGAERILKLTEEQVAKLKEQIGTGFVRDYTQQIREQLDAQKDANFELEYRNRLEKSNMRPEFVDAELRKAKAAREVTQSISVANEALKALEKSGQGNSAEANKLREAIQALVVLYPQLGQAITDNAKRQVEAADRARSFNGSLTTSLQNYYKTLNDFGGSVGTVIQSTFKGLEDQLLNFVTTGKANFKELARSILSDMARIAIQQAIIKPLMGGVMGLFGIPLPNANGNAFAQNGIVPFAMGGVVDKPTLFKFANGGAGQLGLMGEAGPEAIMPLRRGRDGKLGVAAGSGGGSTSVVVNVDASGGSQVQGNPGQAEALGRAVSQAVQNELLRQKRPGGLLAA